MFTEIFLQAWDALRRNPLRSLLTMFGIVWGIAAVTLLLSYGSGFRSIMVMIFNNFSQAAVIMFPGQTSEQAGGERAGRRIRFELPDLEQAQVESPMIRKICPESIKNLPVGYQERVLNANVRGVCTEYGEIRSQKPMEGRWLSGEDYTERRRVVFMGDWLKKKLFSGRPAIGETITIRGMRFQVIGIADQKLSDRQLLRSGRPVGVHSLFGGGGSVGHALSVLRGDSTGRAAFRGPGGGAVSGVDGAPVRLSAQRTSAR